MTIQDEMSTEEADAVCDELQTLEGQALDARLRELGLDPDRLLAVFDRVISLRKPSRSMLKMCALVKIQTLIRITARTAVEHGVLKFALLTALSDDYDIARNEARLAE
jgi:hypothetical protein